MNGVVEYYFKNLFDVYEHGHVYIAFETSKETVCDGPVKKGFAINVVVDNTSTTPIVLRYNPDTNIATVTVNHTIRDDEIKELKSVITTQINETFVKTTYYETIKKINYEKELTSDDLINLTPTVFAYIDHHKDIGNEKKLAMLPKFKKEWYLMLQVMQKKEIKKALEFTAGL